MQEAVKHWNTRGGQSEEDNQLEETTNTETEKNEFDFIDSVKFFSFEMNWTQAMNYIKTTSIETGETWFMPNIETLKYIIKNCRKFGLSRRDLIDDVFWSCENFQDFECKPVILVSAETETRLTLDRAVNAKLIMVKKKN